MLTEDTGKAGEDGTTAHSRCRNGKQAPGWTERMMIRTRLPIATARCNNPVSPPSTRVEEFDEAGAHERRCSGCHGKARCAGRFEGSLLAWAAPEDFQELKFRQNFAIFIMLIFIGLGIALFCLMRKPA